MYGRYALFTLENIPYVDCLLKHTNSHRYVGVWDIDEFLVPAHPLTSLVQMADYAKIKWWQGHAEKCQLNQFSNHDREQFEGIKNLSPKEIHPDSFSNDTERKKFISFIDSQKSKDPECLPPASYVGLCSYFFDDNEEPFDAESNGGLHLLSHLERTMKFAPPLVFTKVSNEEGKAWGKNIFCHYINPLWTNWTRHIWKIF